MRILIIDGPNINMLGIREPDVYGRKTFQDLKALRKAKADKLGIEIVQFQSNHEGDIVDKIQDAYQKFDGIVINPAAYTHTSVAILDALKAVALPAVEVHISDPEKRESFRHISYVSMACEKTIKGMGLDGYLLGIEYLVQKYGK